MQSRVFDDFDAFAESIRDVDSKMLLRNPKHRVWKTSSVDLGAINVQFGMLGSGNIAQGQLRSDGFMLYMPLTENVEYSANGVTLQRGSFAILEPGCEFCITTKVEHDWCVAFIPTGMLDADDLPLSPSRSCYVTEPDQQAAESFRTTLSQIFGTAAQSEQFESSSAVTGAAEEVFRIAQSVVAPGKTVESHEAGRPRVPRHEIIQTTMELLERRNGKAVTVGELAEAQSISERTLRNSFNEYFGMGPARYLQLRKLHEVHRALKAANHEAVTVSDVLIEHGEWAFGRFASRYSQLFGELPSETLRSNSSTR